MVLSARSEAWALHPKPAWAPLVDFVANVELEDDPDSLLRYEQLVFERLPEQRFRLCCVPFYHHGYALGDVVELVDREGFGWTPARVLERSDYWVLRVLLQQDRGASAIRSLIESIHAPVETTWRLVAFAVPGRDLLQRVRAELDELEQEGLLVYETGWTDGG
ncbi:uncharacterized protein DUF4265 [Curtobacterium sp. PhB172]|uniref:DUF4265 domain-containing protein n=1 Tax=unclassified Curtobacterium TaxID=257496 RepID=UPI000F49D752|nr:MULTISPECIES: DUF4265 domain-containing protein [unclassified Curtobacterium]ROQ25201.1 uncharacterized protein DUF4265 [Curtobacterium sp. PhB170]ROS70323.1 uncharacterized protein DUF4265 [Curtobacterium sp. PhB172]ROQ16723.1 uncharacterized protein DUF4265 [Curtobacterium sp. PhB171]ROS36652.1 uncharacterized protein DUF4265 [Curtobacterium sp. PhB131]ROS71329.1 uncharacterized protein DUF4265 [Curtobacterium sp. PhB141]